MVITEGIIHLVRTKFSFPKNYYFSDKHTYVCVSGRKKS